MGITQKLLISTVIVLTFFLLNPSNTSAEQGTTDKPFLACFVESINLQPNQPTTLTIETEKKSLNIKIAISGPENYQTEISDTSPTESRSIQLPGFNKIGTYKLDVTTLQRGFLQASGTERHCTRNAAFNISAPDSQIKLEAPTGKMDKTITTLPELTISGLVPGRRYVILLDNWKGTQLGNTRDSTDIWIPDSNGRITARDICNNGEAFRPNPNLTKSCTEPFGNQNYGISVKEQLGDVVASFFFGVDVPDGSISGRNPCAIPDPKDPEGEKMLPVTECRTALGDIPVDPASFVTKILTVAIGLAGGIALIFMVIGSIKVLTSSGDQQKLTGGKDMIVAAVSGLLFLIFSVLILRFIGNTLLGGIPGF